MENVKSNENEINKNIKQEKSFASGLNFYKLFWIFYIGCFAGVVIELYGV